MLGLAAAATKFDINKFNSTSLHKPYITSKAQSAQAFFDRDFCRDWEDLDAFPHPDSCKAKLIKELPIFQVSISRRAVFDLLVGRTMGTVMWSGTTFWSMVRLVWRRRKCCVLRRTISWVSRRRLVPTSKQHWDQIFTFFGRYLISNLLLLITLLSLRQYCDEYYVCVGGEPILLTCRDGQHWVKNYFI